MNSSLAEVDPTELTLRSDKGGRFGKTVRRRVWGTLVPERLDAVMVTLWTPIAASASH